VLGAVRVVDHETVRARDQQACIGLYLPSSSSDDEPTRLRALAEDVMTPVRTQHVRTCLEKH
jgi:hypothetical protein